MSTAARRYAADHHVASLLLASDPAWFKVNIPQAGNHRIDV